MYQRPPKKQHNYEVTIEYWTPIRDGLLVDTFKLNSELNVSDLIRYLKFNCNVKYVTVLEYDV